MDIIELSSDEETTVTKTEHAEQRKRSHGNCSNINNQPTKRKKFQEDSKAKRRKSNAIANIDLVPGNSSGSASEIDKALEKFIEACLRAKPSDADSMNRIMENKIRKYYNLANPDYRNSESFLKLLISKESDVREKSDKLYIHIQEVVDELKTHQFNKRKCSDQHIMRLCKTLNAVHKKIKKLEKKEVDWEDEENSNYMALQRYRSRLVQIHKKILELEGVKQSKLKKKISVSVCQFPIVNKTIEKFVNAKGQFPDFQDVLELLRKCYQDECLKISEETINAEARTAFVSIGEQLQKLRKSECWESLSSFLETDDQTDPAEKDSELKAILDTSQKTFQARIDECIDEYVTKSKIKKNTSAEKNENEESMVGKNKEEKEKDDEESGGDDEEDEEEEDEGEEVENDTKFDDTESVVIEELDNDDASDDSLGKEGSNIFVYCGPVSPPTTGEGCSTSENTTAEVALISSSSESQQEDDDEEEEKEEEEQQLSSPFGKNNNNCYSTSVANCSTSKSLSKKNQSSVQRHKLDEKGKKRINTVFSPFKNKCSDVDDVIVID